MRRWGEVKRGVVRLHRQNPDWTAPAIARELGTHTHYVREIGRRMGLKIPTQRDALGGAVRASIALSRSELQQVKSAAARTGMTLSGYVRRCVLKAA